MELLNLGFVNYGSDYVFHLGNKNSFTIPIRIMII